jgi:hypothetical protein
VLRIFIALKNLLPWPGSKPELLGPVTSTLTTTPPRRLISLEWTYGSEVRAASIIRASEGSVHSYETTRCYIPDDSKFHNEYHFRERVCLEELNFIYCAVNRLVCVRQ